MLSQENSVANTCHLVLRPLVQLEATLARHDSGQLHGDVDGLRRAGAYIQRRQVRVLQPERLNESAADCQQGGSMTAWQLSGVGRAWRNYPCMFLYA